MQSWSTQQVQRIGFQLITSYPLDITSYGYSKLDQNGVKGKVGLLNAYNKNSCLVNHQLFTQQPASLQQMPWIASIFWPYFMLEFDGAKRKVDLLNKLIYADPKLGTCTSYSPRNLGLAIVFLAISQPFEVRF